MADVLEYRGVSFSIPPNDDGVWRYRVHPGHLIAKVARPQQAPAERIRQPRRRDCGGGAGHRRVAGRGLMCRGPAYGSLQKAA